MVYVFTINKIGEDYEKISYSLVTWNIDKY